ncbi:hypothetical protein RHMOL_Rhmol10G0034000 [Rhododendron molle]|uniref:Uncharacterized protein n=1 Tax=Rhododendron molle TaxID=49168 RepID=A0ACC0LYP2_RHOML|nr:hypothetical protein RHMOL_Rhmol10G0034000 [Rhododendron molle]
MEKLAIRSSSSQAKIIGTVVSISGALVVTLYKGLPIILTPPASISLHCPLGSLHSDWVIGSLFLTVEFMLVPMWYIVQGIFGPFLDNAVNTWVLKVKGPHYLAMFKPLSIVIAVVMGVLFLGDTPYLGSITGAAIISVGFYTVMWGKAKEDVEESGEIGDPESASNPKVPLLQNYLTQEPQS